jgi:ABC-type antimicrobial peptide transport system permease subunit
MALGATVADIHRLVLGEGLRLAGAGAVLGFAAAIASARALRGLLFGIEPLDPWALGAAALLLAAAAILSLYGPARAAGRVEPATALRA